MTDQEQSRFAGSREAGENTIKEHFAGIPRRSLDLPDRQILWLRVHNHILQTKLHSEKVEKASILDIFSLRHIVSKVAVTALIVLLALTVVGGVANAQPGETLYTVKKAAEQVEKALATSDEAKVKVNVKHAKRRLAEVKVLVAGNKDANVVAETLEALKTTTQEVTTATEQKPEFASQAVELAVEQEKILGTVENEVESEVKETVQEIISAAKESISKHAVAKEEDIKGAIVVDENPETQHSTSTASTSPAVGKTNAIKAPRKVKAKPIPQDAPIDSELNIGDVVKIENGEPELSTETVPAEIAEPDPEF